MNLTVLQLVSIKKLYPMKSLHDLLLCRGRKKMFEGLRNKERTARVEPGGWAGGSGSGGPSPDAQMPRSGGKGLVGV